MRWKAAFALDRDGGCDYQMKDYGNMLSWRTRHALDNHMRTVSYQSRSTRD